ncbi:MAG: 3-oxoacyl-[acyl-carrier-protein] synthase III C-terminal domain-containing protein, partial [Hungatella sp.]
IRYFVMHQANYRIFESIGKRLGVSMERMPMNIERYGNTSGASIPILLDEMNRGGKLQRGDKLILAGFGAGLTWGATLLEW